MKDTSKFLQGVSFQSTSGELEKQKSDTLSSTVDDDVVAINKSTDQSSQIHTIETSAPDSANVRLQNI